MNLATASGTSVRTSPKVTMEIKEVGPEEAAAMLSTILVQRPLMAPNFTRIADAITRGEWIFNGEPLIFDEDGHLIDGQHRLHAVIKAGLPIKTLIVRGIPKAAFLSIDLGCIRSPSNALYIAGEKHHVALATALRVQTAWDLGQRASATKLKTSPAQIMATLALHPGMRGAVAFTHEHTAIGRYIGPGYAAFVLYNGGSTWGMDLARSFWTSVETGADLSLGDPALALRDRLAQKETAHRNGRLASVMTSVARLAYAIKAWNAFVKGRSISLLRWGADEDFPEFAQP